MDAKTNPSGSATLRPVGYGLAGPRRPTGRRVSPEAPRERAILRWSGYRQLAGRLMLPMTEAQCSVIQARASRWAVAISTSDIISAISRRMVIASVRPFRAARLNHLWAATRLTTPERPLAQYRPRSNNTSGIAVASTGVA